jgi:hypothetical protein
MPDGTTTRQVLYRRATISLRDGRSEKCWRVFFPQGSFPGMNTNQREYLRHIGTVAKPGSPEKQEASFKSALACVDAMVTEYMKKNAAGA